MSAAAAGPRPGPGARAERGACGCSDPGAGARGAAAPSGGLWRRGPGAPGFGSALCPAGGPCLDFPTGPERLLVPPPWVLGWARGPAGAGWGVRWSCSVKPGSPGGRDGRGGGRKGWGRAGRPGLRGRARRPQPELLIHQVSVSTPPRRGVLGWLGGGSGTWRGGWEDPARSGFAPSHACQSPEGDLLSHQHEVTRCSS